MMTTPAIPFSVPTSFLSPVALWVVFGLLTLAFLVQHLILSYHWRHYAFPDPRLERMRQAYYVGAAAFFGLMLYAIFSAYA